MEVQDLYKFVYQAVLGSEHAVEEATFARQSIEREWAALRHGPPEPLLEPLTPDSLYLRVNLRPFLARGGDPDDLLAAFMATAKGAAGSQARLNRFRGYALRSARAAEIAFSSREMDAFFDTQQRFGLSPVHHSPQYEAAYAPAYRVVGRKQIQEWGLSAR